MTAPNFSRRLRHSSVSSTFSVGPDDPTPMAKPAAQSASISSTATVDGREVFTDDIAIECFLAIIELLSLRFRHVAVKFPNDVHAGAAKRRPELLFGKLDAQLGHRLQPALKVRLIRINQHPVDIE